MVQTLAGLVRAVHAEKLAGAAAADEIWLS
jgi:hypothetical protein